MPRGNGFYGAVGDLEIGRVGSDDLTVEWRIRDVLALPGHGDTCHESPVFFLGEMRWYLRLYPNRYPGEPDPGSGFLRLSLARRDPGPTETFRMSVGLKISAGVERRTQAEREISGVDDHHWSDFCSRSELAGLMQDGVLIIACELKKIGVGGAEDDDLPQKEEQSLKGQIETLQKTVENLELESQNYMEQISTLECEKSSIAEEYKRHLEEKITIISGLVKDNDLLRKEEQSLVEQIKTLQKRVEKFELESETYKRQIKYLESKMSSIEDHKCQLEEKMTIISGIEKVNENREDIGEAKDKKNVKQQSRVKKTKKISLPVRHGDIIHNLKSILAKKNRTDFVLKSGGREWAVHRAILEGRSRHFETLVKEAERDEVRLDDVTGDALDDVLNFLYAGEVRNLSVDNVCGIHAAAHELNLEDMESLCVDYMKEWMCPELVCRALMIPNQELKEEALECYFRESGRIVLTEGWKELKENHPAIVAEIFQEFFKRERNKRKI